MGVRALASAMVSFGLVSIPVKLFSASESSEAISFNLLHRDCGSRLKQKYVCQRDGDEVERTAMVKGYELSKGQYVTFTDDELRALQEKPTQTIEITEFVPAASVDPIYFDRAYYLGPDKGGDRPYALLAHAMRETGRCALAKYAARGKQYLVLLRPMGEGLVMQQLHYANEVRSMSELDLPKVEIKPQELKMAIQLAELAAAESFSPEGYEDEERKRILAAIERKVQGEEITYAAVEETQAPVIDLMEALKASLAKASAKRPAEPASKSSAGIERKPARRAPSRRSDKPATSRRGTRSR